MDQLQSNNNAKKHTRMRPVDLTPMVDLGFILITFFVFTSAMSQSTAMKIYLPADKNNDSMLVKKSSALTVLPVEGDKVCYYFGALNTATQLLSCSTGNLRNVLLSWKTARAGSTMMVIIRPHESGTFGNLVNVLDEMTITAMKSYALAEISNDERLLVEKRLLRGK